MKGWSMDTDDPTCALTHEAVFRATAKAPLHHRGQRLGFDPDEFFALVLNETPSDQQPSEQPQDKNSLPRLSQICS